MYLRQSYLEDHQETCQQQTQCYYEEEYVPDRRLVQLWARL